MPLTVRDDTCTTHVTTAGDEDDVAGVELDEVGDFVLLKVELDRIVRLDERVGVADCAAVVGDDVRNALCADSDAEDLAELVGRLLRGDAVDCKTTLDVVQESEVFARLLDRDHVHEARGVRLISTNPVIDFDEALLDNGSHLATRKRVLQTVPQKDREGEGFAELMGTG